MRTDVVLAAVYLATTSVGFYILYCIEAAPKQIEGECENLLASSNVSLYLESELSLGVVGDI